MKEPKMLPLESLKPHPLNPRIGFREDVINSLVSQIKGTGFSPIHALLVRSIKEGYQIISGHHRAEAARRVGLTEIPCWVDEDMTDEEAHMQLVLSNSQGELKPIEIGMHVLDAVKLSPGGQGVKGGMSEYARNISKDVSYIYQCRNAAKVYRALELTPKYSEKAQHLATIYQADQSVWLILAEQMLERSWSSAETKIKVREVRAFIFPERWSSIFLDPRMVLSHYLEHGVPTPDQVQTLAKAADTVDCLLDEKEQEAFEKWLAAGIMCYSWDPDKITQYAVPKTFGLCEFHHGKITDALTKLPDSSINLAVSLAYFSLLEIYELEEIFPKIARILKPGGSFLVATRQDLLPLVVSLGSRYLQCQWTMSLTFSSHTPLPQVSKAVDSSWIPVVWFSKGDYQGPAINDALHWESYRNEIITKFSKLDDVILELPCSDFGVEVAFCGRQFVGISQNKSELDALEERIKSIVFPKKVDYSKLFQEFDF